jgi:Icc-related predicted phosphoesterase
VYGNHCSKTYFSDLGIENLHARILQFKDKTILGIEGCVRYKEDSYAALYTQEEMFSILKDFPKVDIVITHAPPFGIHDEPNDMTHQGWKALREYIEKYQPDYVLHGHTYPSKGEVVVDMIGKTKIIYIYQDKVIDLY